MKCLFLLRSLIVFFLFGMLLSQTSFGQTNDDCANATTLTSNTSCTNTTGQTVTGAALEAGAPAACSGTVRYDVWYKFVAKSNGVTITLSTIGANFNAQTPRIQVLSSTDGTCSSLTNVGCGTTSYAPTGLIPGNTYYVRIYSTGGTNAPASNAGFSICVQHSLPNACSGAILLNSTTTCINVSGTVIGSTNDGASTSCGTSSYDVWYSFVAETKTPTITLSSIGGNFTSARIQLLSGCGGSSLFCGTTSGTSQVINATGLTIGNTYLIRVYSVSGGGAPASNGGFNLCVKDSPAIITYSKSYINITKGATGGTIAPGDTLEMRGTFVITGGTVNNLAFLDTLYNTKGFRLVPNSLILRTNEGIAHRSYTDIVDGDAGQRVVNGLDTVIRMNFGIGATNAAGGQLSNTSRPSVFGSTCIIMATYRVVVYAPYDTKIKFKTGAFAYTDLAYNTSHNIGFKSDSLLVYNSPGLCPNAVSPTNAIGVESNGTFGVPSGGTPLLRNRTASSYSTYQYNIFRTAAWPIPPGPLDYYHGVTNNTSARFTTINTWAKPDANGYRVFDQWDIIGDHTGASNTATGNPPCDTTLPVSASNPCGYMLIVNSAYKTDTAFQYTVTNLCPNTYYEIAAWFRNICYKCSVDTLGNNAMSASYVPSTPGDTSGVKPNIAFDVNGIDYYTTGNLTYVGTSQTGSDATNPWVKRGFTYKTGPAETSFTLTLRNNAPGGGGNDWAMDDIAVATCSPNMTFTPTANPNFCYGDDVTLGGVINSYFNNFTSYKWQRSTNNGSSWADISSAATGSPAASGGSYQYSVSYPEFTATQADSGHFYRLVVATNTTNLANANCSLSGNTRLTLHINNCAPVLGTNFISFNGKIETGGTSLKWTTTKEYQPLQFIIERSTDGNTFTAVDSVYNDLNYSNVLNTYSWTMPLVTEKYFYRIRLTGTDKEKYTKVIMLGSNALNIMQVFVTNPFRSQITIDVNSPEAGLVRLELIDNNGNLVSRQTYTVQQGPNRLMLSNLSHLSSSLYTLRVVKGTNLITKKVLKQ